MRLVDRAELNERTIFYIEDRDTFQCFNCKHSPKELLLLEVLTSIKDEDNIILMCRTCKIWINYLHFERQALKYLIDKGVDVTRLRERGKNMSRLPNSIYSE